MTALRIKRLTLTDFRAFPGPAPTHFDLDGKNLLVYGENGAGKSSIFHALSEFFTVKRTRNLRSFKNVFSGEPETTCAVAVEFNDGSPSANWGLRATSGAIGAAPIGSHAIGGPGSVREHHPATVSGGSDLRVTQAALRRACLDYRSLLDTNYKHGDGAVNLFDIALERLLTDFPVPVAGGLTRTLGELWQAVEQAKPLKHGPRTLARVNQACADFNNAFNQALAALHPLVGTLLGELIGSDVTVAPFVFGGVTYTAAYYKSARVFAGRVLTMDVSYRSHQLTTPQHFLNEARLSALALAIYLAGRLTCTPTASTTVLKLLVLDDVLIGLDHSNRIPVLDLLENRFKDWQIVLLTHDRLWFETARVRANLNGKWNVVELYESQEADACYRPISVTGKADVVEEYLDRADRHLAANDWRASAVYARSAFEMWLKMQCARHDIPIRFSLEPRKLDSNVYFTALDGWAAHKHAKPALAGVLNVLALYRDTVFNPGSHSYPTNMSGGELRAAVKAMRFVNQSSKFGQSAINIAEKLMSKHGATAEELALAAGYLRVAFIGRLRGLVNGKNLALPFSMEPHRIKPADLWAAMTTLGWPPKRASWVGGINTNSAVLLDDWAWPTLLAFTVAQLQSALQVVKQH